MLGGLSCRGRRFVNTELWLATGGGGERRGEGEGTERGGGLRVRRGDEEGAGAGVLGDHSRIMSAVGD